MWLLDNHRSITGHPFVCPSISSSRNVKNPFQILHTIMWIYIVRTSWLSCGWKPLFSPWALLLKRVSDVKTRKNAEKFARAHMKKIEKVGACLICELYYIRGGRCFSKFFENPSLSTTLLHVGWTLTLQLVVRRVKPLWVTLTASYWIAKKVCGPSLLHTLGMVVHSGQSWSH